MINVGLEDGSIPEDKKLTEKFSIDFEEENLYDLYVFGDNTEIGWVYDKDYKLTKKDNIYSIELNLLNTNNGLQGLTLYTLGLNSDGNDFASKKEFAKVKVEEDGLYRFEFTYRSNQGLTNQLVSNDNTLVGYYRLTKLNNIESPEETPAGENLLSGAPLVNYEKLGLNQFDLTNGVSPDGGNIPSEKLRKEKTTYMFEMETVQTFDSFKVSWEASRALEYEIWVTNDVDAYNTMKELLVNETEETDTDPAKISNWVKVASYSDLSNPTGVSGVDTLKCDNSALGKYVILRTLTYSTNAQNYGYWLYDIEGYAKTYDHSIVGAQLGVKEVNGETTEAIRFIGKSKILDPETFTDVVSFELEYTSLDNSVTKKSNPIEIRNFYKTLTTSMGSVINVELTAEEGYYYFSFTLTNVVEGSYQLTLNVSDEDKTVTNTIGSVSYLYQNNTLTRK